MKLKIEFGFGIEYRGDGSAILKHEQLEGIARIAARATDLFGGHTLTHTLGEWYDKEADYVVAEAGCTVSVLVDRILTKYSPKLEDDITEMVQQIKASLQQKAVAVSRTEI